MEKKFKESVLFRDKENYYVKVDFEIRDVSGVGAGKPIFMMSGDRGGAMGQIEDHIIPATDAQKELVEMWQKYHWKPVNADEMKARVEDLIGRIGDDEEAHTKRIPAIFDMSDEDFEPNDHIEEVMELRDCDENEAKAFLALGMELEVTCGELNETFTRNGNIQYFAFGDDFYIGDEGDLEEEAKRQLRDNDYWKEAVRTNQTELGLEDWVDEVVDYDGWANILNSYDGSSFTCIIGNQFIEGCRM